MKHVLKAIRRTEMTEVEPLTAVRPRRMRWAWLQVVHGWAWRLRKFVVLVIGGEAGADDERGAVGLEFWQYPVLGIAKGADYIEVGVVGYTKSVGIDVPWEVHKSLPVCMPSKMVA